MALNPTTKLMRAGSIIILMLCLVCLGTSPGLAQQETQSQSEPQEKTFPGFNEVVPQATALAAKITDANNQIKKSEGRQSLYDNLDALQESLAKVEEQYKDWENVDTWQINHLLRAQATYGDLAEQQTKQLDVINSQLQSLESLRVTWEQEKKFWQEWQKSLRQTGVKVPVEEFKRTHQEVDSLLQRITLVASELIKSQQKYAPGQEIITSRLNTIDKAMDTLRRNTFRRNAIEMFEPDFYHQFDRELFSDFKENVVTNSRLPDGFVQRHGKTIGVYLFAILIISMLFAYRTRRGMPLSDEWAFLFRRPLSSAIFISIASIGLLTELNRNLPINLKWLLFMAITIAAMRLLNAFYSKTELKNAIRAVAVVFIITKTLRTFGLPTPLLQLYNVLLCALTIPVCWHLIRKPGMEILRQRPWIFLLLGVAIIGLISSALGFESFTTNLIDATLTTYISLIIVKMALYLAKNGVASLIQVEGIRNRNFIQLLGVEEATSKLQLLVSAIILVNFGIHLLVVWKIFDSATEAHEALLGFEYTIGEVNISVQMILLVVIILYLTTIISWVIQAFVDSQFMTPRKMDIGVKESLKRLTHYALFTVGFLVAVSMAGLGLQNLSIVVGALGVGIGFGLQNIVNNFVSGLILLFERPVKVGDVINIDQDWGTITKIGLRSTIFETFDRSEIIVPNADLIAQKVTNWTFSSKIVRVVLPVGVAYGSPLEKVLEILTRAAKENPDVLSYPPPSPIFTGFGNSSIDFELRVWIQTIDDRLKVYSELGVQIDRLFREEGIEIPFPQRDLHLRSIDSNLQTLFGVKPQQAQMDTEGTPE